MTWEVKPGTEDDFLEKQPTGKPEKHEETTKKERGSQNVTETTNQENTKETRGNHEEARKATKAERERTRGDEEGGQPDARANSTSTHIYRNSMCE